VTDRYDLVIVGMGPAGSTAAHFATSLGFRVAGVERSRLGGDTLWTGSVPPKALLAAARTAHVMRHADRFGIEAVEPHIDRRAVWPRLRTLRHQIAVTEDDPGPVPGEGRRRDLRGGHRNRT
jgi:pyruvate/2-oxoglutarate dehydrogenase complex dihydrolipoamide dehydrogenase (E3) component